MSFVGEGKHDLLERINNYKWYHKIRVTGEIYTKPDERDYREIYGEIWDFIMRGLLDIDFTNKRVLDVGCRDGLFCFEAERRGAMEIIGIDNDLSRGAVELLIPFFHSKVKMYELNLYDLTPQRFGFFDVILCFGVLYHLRYPFWGLRKLVDCLSDGGMLVIESGMLLDKQLENWELLYCPAQLSSYDPTSCTFFNALGLSTTLAAFGLRLVDHRTKGANSGTPRSSPSTRSQNQMSRIQLSPRLVWRFVKKTIMNIKPHDQEKTGLKVGRQFFIFKRDEHLRRDPFLENYWNATHSWHSCDLPPFGGPTIVRVPPGVRAPSLP